jgi:hypothetical protein
MNVAGGRWLPSLPANEELNWLLLCLLVLDSKQSDSMRATVRTQARFFFSIF